MGAAATLASVVGIWAAAAIVPGPNFLITVRTAVTGSARESSMVVLGIATGTVIWGLAGFFGVAALIAALPALFTSLKIAGGAYLVWLGVKTLAGCRRSAQDDSDPVRLTGPSSALWRHGLLVNLLNPKTAAFVASLFAVALPPSPPLWLGFAAVGTMGAVSLAWYSLVAYVLATPYSRGAFQQAQRPINGMIGAVFIALGVLLALQG